MKVWPRSFEQAFSRKSDVVNALNSKNYHNLADDIISTY